MTRVKKEHFVPQFHLREWLLDGRLWVKDLTRGNCYSTRDLTGVLSERAFYDLPEVDEALGVFQATEKSLGRVETLLGTCAEEARAVALGVAAATKTLPFKLGVYGALQFFRTKGFRTAFGDYLNWRLDQMKDAAWAHVGGSGPAPAVKLKDGKRAHIGVLHAPNRLLRFAEKLASFNLVLYVPNERLGFVTSDAPAVITPDPFTGYVPLEVWEHEFTAIGFPVAPDCYCELRNPLFDRHEPGTYRAFNLQDEGVAIKNGFTILNASEKVISPTDAWPEVTVLDEMRLLTSRGLTGGGVVCPFTGQGNEGLRANWAEFIPRQFEFARRVRHLLC